MPKTLELSFPAAGVVRRLGFRGTLDVKDSFPTPWAVNVRPEDPIARRLRGGSRPGLSTHSGMTVATGELSTEAGDSITTEAGDSIIIDIISLHGTRDDVREAIAQLGVDVLDGIEASKGTAPTGYTMGCTYRDRLVVTGGDHVVYMSRQGAFDDWDYASDSADAGGAVLMQLSEASETGDTVTALVPHKDQYLMMATAGSLWVLHGDPVAGGRMECVTRDVGMLSKQAWAKAGDTVFFMSRYGLYSIGIDGSGLKKMSEDRIPVELNDLDLDDDVDEVLVGYNHGEGGVYIFVNGADYHWYYDLIQGGFWPFTWPATYDPDYVLTVNGEMVIKHGTSFKMISGTQDGSTAIDSHVVIGPIRPGGPARMGMVSSIRGLLGESSGAVTWRLVAGDTAQEAADNAKAAIALYQADDSGWANYVSASGSWSAGRNGIAYPRTRGIWVAIWLQSEATWAYEGIIVDIQEFGRWR